METYNVFLLYFYVVQNGNALKIQHKKIPF